MIRFTILPLLGIALLLYAGCDDPSASPLSVTGEHSAAKGNAIPVAVDGKNNNGPSPNRNSVAVLSAREEVPPNSSRARGLAKLQFNKDFTELTYKLIVANIENVAAAHIHLGPAGVNGPVILPLYSAPPGGGRIQGPIAEATVTASHLVGLFKGSTDFGMFIAALHADSLYVNVHTNDGVDPPDTGPGDILSGEIRGQIKAGGN